MILAPRPALTRPGASSSGQHVNILVLAVQRRCVYHEGMQTQMASSSLRPSPAFPAPSQPAAPVPSHAEAADRFTPAAERPVPAGPLSFPADEGSHPGAKTEWFYLNGHLQAPDGHRFAFMQALFDVPDAFRARYNVDLPGNLGATQLHSSLLDAESGEHQASREMHLHLPFGGKQDLEQGHLDESFATRRDGFELRRVDATHLHVEAPSQDGHLSLDLEQVKPPLLMGGEGEIAMGPKGLSKYYTLPQLQATGTVTSHGVSSPVSGTVWMDHQWGDMAMLDGYKGWDWFGVQLGNGTQLNMFNFRGADGASVQANVGISRPDGSQEHVSDLKLEPLSTWDSPHTGRRYPTAWHVVVPSKHIDLTVSAEHPDQEMVGMGVHRFTTTELVPTYWEGQTRVEGTIDAQPVEGNAFLEMVGYDRAASSALPAPEPAA